MKIRVATVDDAEGIRRIYEPYVLETAVSFEYEVPGVAEFGNRIQRTLAEYPYLVAVDGEKIVGYAYAGAFHSRAAYKHSAELSVYVDKNYRKQGIGSTLYTKLQDVLMRQNIYSVHVCIASPEEVDEHLSKDSELFHGKMGFVLAGRHEHCGYKFGKWYSIVWMDKLLCQRPEKPNEFIPFPVLGQMTT